MVTILKYARAGNNFLYVSGHSDQQKQNPGGHMHFKAVFHSL